MAEYIEREKALEECDWYANEFCECEYAIMPLKWALELLPAADVRPVLRGEWWKSLNPGFSPFDDSGEYRYRCNRCGHTQNCELNFCPHCGADMREES